MPTAKKLPSGSWRCQVYSHTEDVIQKDGSIKKKRIYKSFTCDDPTAKGRRKAERMAADWAENKDRISKSDMTIKEAVERYIQAKKGVLSPSTVRGYMDIQRNYIPLIGDKKLDRTTQEDIQSWVGQLSANHSPKTVKNAHSFLSSVFSMYYPDLRLNTKLPQKKPAELNIPVDEDVQRLLDHVRGRELEIAIELAAFGPMRRGEICALQSSDIRGNVVSVTKDMVLSPEKEWIVKQPKTPASVRDIVYPDFVIDKIKGIQGRIITCTPDQLTNRFRRAVKYTGIKKIRFHDLRHYSASIMHAIGIPDAYIIERGGWSTDGVMKTIYRHTLTDRQREINQKANNYFSNICNTKYNTK